ncbi:MAG: hypothetical protein ACRCSK_05550 [Fusobacteriaceae bacterium]
MKIKKIKIIGKTKLNLKVENNNFYDSNKVKNEYIDYFSEGLDFFHNGNYEKAIECFSNEKEFLKDKKRISKCYKYIGKCFSKLSGCEQTAKSNYEQAHILNKEDYQLYFILIKYNEQKNIWDFITIAFSNLLFGTYYLLKYKAENKNKVEKIGKILLMTFFGIFLINYIPSMIKGFKLLFH